MLRVESEGGMPYVMAAFQIALGLYLGVLFFSPSFWSEHGSFVKQMGMLGVVVVPIVAIVPLGLLLYGLKSLFAAISSPSENQAPAVSQLSWVGVIVAVASGAAFLQANKDWEAKKREEQEIEAFAQQRRQLTELENRQWVERCGFSGDGQFLMLVASGGASYVHVLSDKALYRFGEESSGTGSPGHAAVRLEPRGQQATPSAPTFDLTNNQLSDADDPDASLSLANPERHYVQQSTQAGTVLLFDPKQPALEKKRIKTGQAIWRETLSGSPVALRTFARSPAETWTLLEAETQQGAKRYLLLVDDLNRMGLGAFSDPNNGEPGDSSHKLFFFEQIPELAQVLAAGLQYWVPIGSAASLTFRFRTSAGAQGWVKLDPLSDMATGFGLDQATVPPIRVARDIDFLEGPKSGGWIKGPWAKVSELSQKDSAAKVHIHGREFTNRDGLYELGHLGDGVLFAWPLDSKVQLFHPGKGRRFVGKHLDSEVAFQLWKRCVATSAADGMVAVAVGGDLQVFRRKGAGETDTLELDHAKLKFEVQPR